MKVNQFLDSKTGMVIAISAVAAITLYVAEKKAREAAAAVGEAVNPLNNDNVFYTGVNNVGAHLTGNDNFNLGGWIYDITH